MFYNYPKKDDQPFRSFNLNFGGGKENRTPDPLLAKQVLSQLSYTPAQVLPMSLPSFLFEVIAP